MSGEPIALQGKTLTDKQFTQSILGWCLLTSNMERLAFLEAKQLFQVQCPPAANFTCSFSGAAEATGGTCRPGGS